MKITGKKMPKLSTKEPAQWETTTIEKAYIRGL
jgi:hypothetical protein